ncbi:GGDEF domain-containing protein [Pediococcus pentosaceus]|uniref:GGDEF domain-containing protein n=1 Tax=Pediococcus pentosaceus TaxID=1255 RepID=UPI002FBEE24B
MENTVMNTIIYWAKGFFSFNTVVIAAITVGVLFMLAAGTYVVEMNMDKTKTSSTLIEELLWGVGLTIAMVFLQNVFTHLYSTIASSELGWKYSTAQFVVLFYCLYIVHRRVVLWFNIILPMYVYGLGIVRGQIGFDIAPILAILVIILISYTIYQQNDTLIDENVKYYSTLIMFGLAWWFVLKDIHHLTIVDIMCLTLEFLIAMSIVHFGNKKVRMIMKQYLNLMQEVDTDALTGVYNRNSFNKVVKGVFEFYSNNDAPLTMVMFDIDHFKQFNDQYGHQVGDKVLRLVADRFSYELVDRKAHGQLFRVGGEEFAIIFRGRTADDCEKIVRAIRDDLVKETIRVNNHDRVGIKVSIGISQLRDDDFDFQTFYKRVDDYLYQSKRNKRNSITVEGKVASLN